MRYLLRSVFAIISIPLIYLLFAVVLGLVPVNRSFDADTSEGVEIFISSSGIHTSFIVPIKSESVDWQSYFPASHFRRVNPSTVTHIAFGWGDRNFYLETPTWADLKASTVAQALFLKSNSVMHVTYLQQPMSSANVKRVTLSQHQYAQLVGYITRSFNQNIFGQLEWISGSGYGRSDTFYRAMGSYSVFKTCNDWTGKGLREVGVKMGIWTPLAQSVIYYL